LAGFNRYLALSGPRACLCWCPASLFFLLFPPSLLLPLYPSAIEVLFLVASIAYLYQGSATDARPQSDRLSPRPHLLSYGPSATRDHPWLLLIHAAIFPVPDNLLP
ncbi:hypothetical protein POJ06DRAFT_16557, partial [Lipomyces tetrasporus]